MEQVNCDYCPILGRQLGEVMSDVALVCSNGGSVGHESQFLHTIAERAIATPVCARQKIKPVSVTDSIG